MAYFTTSDLHTALATGYIGEVLVKPTPLADAIHEALTGRRLPSWTMYYYGTPDARLRELFGYA